MHRLLPRPRFEIHDVLVESQPWDVRLAIRASIHSTVLGEPYRHDFGQFRWLRCRRLAQAGVAEAAEGPISHRGP